MSVSEPTGSGKPNLVAMVNGRVLEPGESVKLPRIEERLRNAGLPVLIGDEIKSKKVRKALYRDWKADFALYGEADYVIMSYAIQLDDRVKETIEKHAVNQIKEEVMCVAITFEGMDKIISETKYDYTHFPRNSFSWFEDPTRINGVNADFVKERELHTEYFKDIALKMEGEFHGLTREEPENKYSFRLIPVVTLDGEKTSTNPIGLKVTYKLAG